MRVGQYHLQVGKLLFLRAGLGVIQHLAVNIHRVDFSRRPHGGGEAQRKIPGARSDVRDALTGLQAQTCHHFFGLLPFLAAGVLEHPDVFVG